jgi:hypothetical protein
MVAHPISVPRDGYAGRDSRRREKASLRNEVVGRCEAYLNKDFPARDSQSWIYSYGTLASTLNLTVDAVRDALFDVGGHNGITINRARADTSRDPRP